jgi:hypothetical protein
MPSKRSVGGARGWIDRLEPNPAGGNRAGKATASIGAGVRTRPTWRIKKPDDDDEQLASTRVELDPMPPLDLTSSSVIASTAPCPWCKLGIC